MAEDRDERRDDTRQRCSDLPARSDSRDIGTVRRLRHRMAAALALAAAASLALTACASPGYSTSSGQGTQRPTCEALLDRVVELDRAGQTGNGYDNLSEAIDTLGNSSCPLQWDIWFDYSSTTVMAEFLEESSGGPVPCSEVIEGAPDFQPRALQLLRDNGYCTSDPIARPQPAPEQWPGGGIGWNDAINRVGSYQRVCGPLISVRGSNDDVFLNIGRDYPDPGRFIIVIWDIGGIEPIEAGTTVCTSGLVTSYQGVAEIELRAASDVLLYN